MARTAAISDSADSVEGATRVGSGSGDGGKYVAMSHALLCIVSTNRVRKANTVPIPMTINSMPSASISLLSAFRCVTTDARTRSAWIIAVTEMGSKAWLSLLDVIGA